jgi:hypothetical protein
MGVVRRRLEGQVQRDLQAVLAGTRDQAAKILLGTQLGMDRLVPTLG